MGNPQPKRTAVHLDTVAAGDADSPPPSERTSADAGLAGNLDSIVSGVREAQHEYAHFDQEQVDDIFKAAALAASANRIALAREAAEETRMGVMEDKVIKNHFAAEYIYNRYKNSRTCGILEEDVSGGFTRIAEPIGIIAAILPTTNPTSTAIFKALLALKTRNGVIFSPHPRARGCTATTVDILRRAAEEAGCPEGLFACLGEPTLEMSNALMRHPDVKLILATGGPGMVRAAYSSGKPAIGVGAGNTPVFVDETADVRMAVSSILMSKTFDNGVICASEQSLIVSSELYEQVMAEFQSRGAHLLTQKQKARLQQILVGADGHVSSKIVGQPAARIAEAAGFEVPADTKVLLAECTQVGQGEPYSMEKLSPVLAVYQAADFDVAMATCAELIEYGGAGHTAVLYTDTAAGHDHVARFQTGMRVGRCLINMPASQGAIGDVYNFRLPPSLTLGCGSWGGNSVSENIGVQHLMNVKSVAQRRENMQWVKLPPRIYFKYGALAQALGELADRQRAFIVTDKTMEQMGYVRKVTDVLDGLGTRYRVFSEVKPNPDVSNVEAALEQVRAFEPDLFIALGGGSPMDAAKFIWLLYENPEQKFEDVAMRFMDIRKRISEFPGLGRRAIMVSVPTTSGSGSEVTPFTVITDDRTGVKYPIADYALTPDMAIVDPELVTSLPRVLVAHTGLDALTHAVEAYTSIYANNYTDGMALESLRLIFKYLRDSYHRGQRVPQAREKMHYAATISGMAFANAFLGVCHSMAHKMGASLDMPHGLANALLLPHVIRYNATDKPTKQGLLPAYRYPFVKGRYAKIADHLRLADDIEGDPQAPRVRDAKVERLIEAIRGLMDDLEIPRTIRDAGVPESVFLDLLDEMSEQAFDDQCTGGNARYPLIEEIRALYIRAYYDGEAPDDRIPSREGRAPQEGFAILES
jgi:acetaldehyde dehydrogenase/alcohol dehydrogenase